MVTSTIIDTMKTVNIRDLKAQLSAHIQLVRNGEEVLVCDRSQPVAPTPTGCSWYSHGALEQTPASVALLAPPVPLFHDGLSRRPPRSGLVHALKEREDLVRENLRDSARCAIPPLVFGRDITKSICRETI